VTEAAHPAGGVLAGEGRLGGDLVLGTLDFVVRQAVGRAVDRAQQDLFDLLGPVGVATGPASSARPGSTSAQ